MVDDFEDFVGSLFESGANDPRDLQHRCDGRGRGPWDATPAVALVPCQQQCPMNALPNTLDWRTNLEKARNIRVVSWMHGHDHGKSLPGILSRMACFSLTCSIQTIGNSPLRRRSGKAMVTIFTRQIVVDPY